MTKKTKVTEDKTTLNNPSTQAMSVMELLRFGSGELLKDAIAMEINEYLGRSHYQRAKSDEEHRGYRNGSQKTTLDTPIGPIEYDRPKVAYAPDFKSQFHVPHIRRPEEFAASVADMYANGVSTRKVKDSLKSITGKKVHLAKSTVSRITKKLRREFAQWKSRDLSNMNIKYLFVDAIRVGMRMGGKGKDSVLIAYGCTSAGDWETLAIDIAQSESKGAWGRFVSSLKSRGLVDPLLVISDGNKGVIEAIDQNFTTSYRQRCLKHRFENILDAVPANEQEAVGKKLKQIFYGATSLGQAKVFLQEFKKQFSKRYPTAVSRLDTDIDQCLTYYLFPAYHWRRIRTGNKIERLNREIRRRLKVIGRHPDEEGCLSLIYHVSRKYAFGQRGCRVDELTIKLWEKLRVDKISMIEQLELDLHTECA